MANNRRPTGMTNRARPAELLAACKSSLVKQLLADITPAFESTKEALFVAAEKAPSTELQNRMLEAQRVLLNKKVAFTEAYSDELGGGFAELIEGKAQTAKQDPADGEEDDEDGGLSLVGKEDLEEILAISDMVSKAEVRFTQPIYALNQRLTVLNRGRPVKNDSNPCGPLMIGKAIRHAAKCLDLEAEVKVVLYNRLDQLLQKNMDRCYQEINDHLAAAGILPNIKLAAPKRAANTPPLPAAQTQEQMEAEAIAEAEQLAQATGMLQSALADAGRPVPGATQPDAVDFFGRALRSRSTESAASGVPAAPEIVASIREMMASQAADSNVQPQPGSVVIAPEHLVGAALSKLQSGCSNNEASSRLSADEIKRFLAKSLGADPASGKPISLTRNDAQTIDIIDLLYDHIHQEQLLQEPVQNLLHKMQVPMIRVAMQDEKFFEDTEHPARQFFNTVADAGELWLEDDPENSKTFQNIETTLDRVLKDYQGDSDVFKGLLGELNRHISLLSRKATLAERRHVDAARGQEKLELAREQARRLIERLVKKYRPPKFVESVLSQPWADYLALIVLRHGDDSEQWKGALNVAKTLIFSVRDDLDDNIKTSLRKRVPLLCDELTKGLSQVGYFEQDILVVLDNLHACYKWSLAPEPIEEIEKIREAPAELETALPATQTVEKKSKSESEPEKSKTKRPKRADLNEKERAMVAKIRLLAFGTWFEIKFSSDSEFVKRKLSWYSPVTSRCLFVNNRGSIAEEIYLEELAQSMAAGQARVFQPNKKPLIDRAFSAIFGRLKKMTTQVAGSAAKQS